MSFICAFFCVHLQIDAYISKSLFDFILFFYGAPTAKPLLSVGVTNRNGDQIISAVHERFPLECKYHFR